MKQPIEKSETIKVNFVLNGRRASHLVQARTSLASMLREAAGATSVHLGCEHGICGACTILLDGVSSRSCLLLAVQASGTHIETLEGASASGRISDLQQAFVERAALQCGFCTPGMLLTADEFIMNNPDADREAIRAALSGNLCRCTGYQAIVDAVEQVGQQRRRAIAGAMSEGVKTREGADAPHRGSNRP